MDFDIEIPKLSDGADRDVKKLYAYLATLTEQLKYVLSNLDNGNFTTELSAAVTSVGGTKRDVTQLKEAIIKTAQVIKKTEDKIVSEMRNNYVAASALGEYTEEAIASYEVDGMGIGQYFDLITSVAGEVDRLAGYIKTGVLDGGEIGVEIGDIGREGDSPFKVRLTGTRLSFYSGGDEVAYMSDSSLHVTKAVVDGTFSLGDYLIDPSDGLVFKYAGE